MADDRNARAESIPVILVVDDSAMDRHLAGSLLQDGLGARIVNAANGRDALFQLGSLTPSLVLTDLQMPEMDGLELVAAIRSQYPRLPVVLMTAMGSEELAMRALEAGAASYVSKRALTEDLVSTVEHILSGNRLERRRNRLLENITRFECEFNLENDPALVPHLVAHIQEQMVRMNLCNENGKIRVGVALEEALLNAIYHGNLELSSDLRQDGSNRFHELAVERRKQTPYRDRHVQVQVRLSKQEGSIVVRDEGPGFDIDKVPDPTAPESLLLSSGRGLLLIRTFMDEVMHNSAGNEITMVKRRMPG